MTRIVVLTGAGISAESGLSTFRDPDGLWARYDLADLATPEAFARDPDRVLTFYDARRAACQDARPNAAHVALARLSAVQPREVTLVTQNVDDLHERAGHAGVIHMHGELARALCAACGHRWPAPRTLTPDTPCPACGGRHARPDVVWFGEMPYRMEEIGACLAHAGLFVAIGTSGTVHPAAGFVMEARGGGARTLEITLDGSEVSHLFDEVRRGPAGTLVPAWVDEVLSQGK